MIVDVVEIGEKQAKLGDVLKVKPLAVLAMIDEGELDWKVVAISVDDPKADLVNNVADVEKHFPVSLLSPNVVSFKLVTCMCITSSFRLGCVRLLTGRVAYLSTRKNSQGRRTTTYTCAQVQNRNRLPLCFANWSKRTSSLGTKSSNSLLFNLA